MGPGTASLEACKALCLGILACKGVEYQSSGQRCKVWTSESGIGVSIPLPGYTCLRAEVAGELLSEFSPVDGGTDRACRGASSSDNSASYYTVVDGPTSIQQCKADCAATQQCQGI